MMRRWLFVGVLAATLVGVAAEQKVEYVENARVRVGVDLNAGGAIMHVEDKILKTGNMINYFDRGRQIQQSYYSGPVPYIGPNGEQPSKHWAGLGWNPIQTGDCAGNASPVLAFSRPDDETMVIRTAPLLWPHSGVRAECEFVTTIRLTPNGFRYDAAIKNARSDKTDYARRPQEMPAVYTNARWYKLVSYLGTHPWTDEPTTVIVGKGDGKGWPWRCYFTPESWSALLDDRDTGIGVYNAASYSQSAGFAGQDGQKGQNLSPRAAPTGYIAPNRHSVLDANATLAYSALFAVGRLDEMRRTFAAEAQRHPVVTSWTFTQSRLGWTHQNAVSTGYPLTNAYAIALKKGADLASPLFYLPTSSVRRVTFIASATRAEGKKGKLPLTLEVVPFSPADLIDYPAWNIPGVNVAEFRREAQKKHPVLEPIRIPIELVADGAFHTVTCDVPATSAPAFKRLAFRFSDVTNVTFALRSLRLHTLGTPQVKIENVPMNGYAVSFNRTPVTSRLACYANGERPQFRVTASERGKPLANGVVDVVVEVPGDWHKRKVSVWLDVKGEGLLTVPCPDRPGWVFVADAPDHPRSSAGAMYDGENIRAAEPAPADFKSFWQAEIAALKGSAAPTAIRTSGTTMLAERFPPRSVRMSRRCGISIPSTSARFSMRARRSRWVRAFATRCAIPMASSPPTTTFRVA